MKNQDEDVKEIKYAEEPDVMLTSGGSAFRIMALTKTISTLSDTFVQDIKQKDRIIQKCVDKIEEEVLNIE